MDKPCAFCGQPMVDRTRSRAKFCSTKCKDGAHNAARRQILIDARGPRACAYCGKELAADRRADAITCRGVCVWKYQNRVRATAAKAERRAHREPCAECGGPIPIDARAGVAYCSKACRKRRNDREWRAKSTGYMRRYLYGLTPEDYAALLEKQDNRCAVCRTDTPGGKGGWHVDHDHATKAIRGLLCHSCNVALGNFMDDPERLRAALAYLS